METRVAHWQQVYSTKAAETVSWYQPDAGPSVQHIIASSTPAAYVADVGTGDGYLLSAL
jgi:methylase of polypeptide subunit release factors